MSKDYREKLPAKIAEAQAQADATGRPWWVVRCSETLTAHEPVIVDRLCSRCESIRQVLPRRDREAAFKALLDAIALAQEQADAAGRPRWLACYYPTDGSQAYYKVQAENRLFATGKARGVMLRKILPREPGS